MVNSCRYILFLLLMGLSCSLSFAQSYTSVQYTTTEGLPAATVYCMLQDRNGFIWFGTEAGVCRFDGTHFKTFTIADGLPDNEILKMHEDSQGRIWMMPFKNAISYYQDGKFFNQENDTVLRKINVRERLLNMFEDAEGTVWFNETDGIYKIKKNGIVEKITSLGGMRLEDVYYFGYDRHGVIWFSASQDDQLQIYKYEHGRSSYYATVSIAASPNDILLTSDIRVWRSEIKGYSIESGKYSPKRFTISPPLFPNTFSYVNDSLISINTQSGAILFDLATGQEEATLMAGKSVSYVMRDKENNWWVSTLGEGVFRIPSENFRNLDADPKDALLLMGDRIDSLMYLTTTDLWYVQVRLPGIRTYKIAKLPPRLNRVLSVQRNGDKYLLVTEYGIYNTDPQLKALKELMPTIFAKQVARQGNLLFIAAHSNVFTLDMERFQIIDTPWHGRSTSVFFKRNGLYVGTLHGLYFLEKNKPVKDLGETNPLLKSRISGLVESSDGSLWVGTMDHGLIQLRGDTVVRHYTKSNGLSSDICRTVIVDGKTVWVGTNKGLNRIVIDHPGDKITTITRSDGLNSDQVNKIIVYGDTVFVGTSAGITYFNKKRLNQYSECRLHILDISGHSIGIPRSDVFVVRNKQLNISYAGISFKSAGDILYSYRLKGIDDNWKTTRETTLEFVALPYGRYDLELKAENKLGVISNTVTIKLEVPIPFWKTAWFYILLAIGFVGLVYWWYRHRLKVMRSRETEKTSLDKKLVEMELQALRAQMNPHFTFNVLNSIQYYIGYNDTVAAQNYLSKFAKLIRLTLDNSKNTFITLKEEIYLLNLYLDLEKMRFGDKFSYDIVIEESIDQMMLIPNMVIQPFVENAIKHGFKTVVKNAKVEIRIVDSVDSIHCTITDNGGGRNNASLHKQAADHKPSGVAMVMDKTAALRHYYNYNVLVEIIDLYSGNNEPSGTMVFIRIPKQAVIV